MKKKINTFEKVCRVLSLAIMAIMIMFLLITGLQACSIASNEVDKTMYHDEIVCYKAVSGGLFSPNYLKVDCDSGSVDVKQNERVLN
jgi:hypothetical protein